MNIKNNKNCKITINDEEIKLIKKEKTADELFKELGYKKINLKSLLFIAKKKRDIKNKKNGKAVWILIVWTIV